MKTGHHITELLLKILGFSFKQKGFNIGTELLTTLKTIVVCKFICLTSRYNFDWLRMLEN